MSRRVDRAILIVLAILIALVIVSALFVALIGPG